MLGFSPIGSQPLGSAPSGTAAPSDTAAPTMNGSITVSAITSSGFTLSWPAATDNVAVTGYEVSINGGGLYTDVGNVLTISETGLTASTGYPVLIRSYDAASNRAIPLSVTATTSAAASTVTSVTVAPGTASGSQQFTATVVGTNNPSQTVTWATNLGSISSTGYFTAPATTGSTQTATITATSVQDGTKSGTATATIASSFPFTWSALTGTITATGLYTAPAATNVQQSDTITAISTADSTKRGTATVTIAAAGTSTVTSVAVSPTTASGNTTFTAVVNGQNSPSQLVNWTTTIGSINSSGVLTAPSAISAVQTGTVTAKSVQDGVTIGTAAVTIAAFVSVADTIRPTMTGALTSPIITSTGCTVDWSGTTRSDNVGIAGFEYSTDSTTYVDAGMATSHAFTGFQPSTGYGIYVRAYDAAGNRSTPALYLLVTTASVQAPGTRSITLNFVNPLSVAIGNLSGFEWTVYAGLTAGNLGAVIGSGTGKAILAGAITITVNTSLPSGSVVTLALSNSNGSPTQNPSPQAFFAPVVLS